MKYDITSVDKNFLEGSVFEHEGLIWRSIHDAPLEIRGLAVHKDETFCRLPLEVLPVCSEGVRGLSFHTAGGRVRFITNSKRLAVRAESRNSGSMTHMPVTGSAGADVYVNGVFKAIIRPANDDGGWFEGMAVLDGRQNAIEINLPLYNGIKNLLIGTDEDAEILPPRAYMHDVPVVYYGSSITQGGCASRPGNSYQGFISRKLDSDHINLGFSGNAKGEDDMARYIAGLNMSVFVYDYDHNAPNPEHLEKTHERFFRIIRAAQPKLPVIMISKPDIDKDLATGARRREIIRRTYENAVADGDKYVRFIDGETLFGIQERDGCTVDGSHPNDLGFYRMAEHIYPVIKEMLV